MITRERWTQLEEKFAALVDLSPAERASALAAVDDTLRADVEEMLARADAAKDRVPTVVAHAVSRTRRPTAPMLGRRVGPYNIDREIGHGGMGAVYLATRSDDYQARVAIKLLHRGLETEQAVARFRDERQMLAALDHPNIVRLIDGGATTEGLPYLVMEYVEGLPLTAHANQHDLSIRARVELFRGVCAGIHYAHSKLIVHRDLKPSNILVSSNGTPKVLDFGIAKLLDATGPRPEAHTRTGMLLLTPEYASPEQARGEAASTASDVYSLGAVLYDLLCGVPPHTTDGTALEILHKLVEEPVVMPSRAAAPERRGELRGDLDNILLKALDKDPARRYASADHFAEDLRRYLDRLPVDARSATWSYRASKFIRRNWFVVATAALLGIALTVATVVSIDQAQRAELERDRAERETATAQRRFADVRALANTLLFEIEHRIGGDDERPMVVKEDHTYGIALCRVGSTAFIGCDDGRILAVRLPIGEVIAELTCCTKELRALTSADAMLYALDGRVISAIDPVTHEVTRIIELPGAANALAIHADRLYTLHNSAIGCVDLASRSFTQCAGQPELGAGQMFAAGGGAARDGVNEGAVIEDARFLSYDAGNLWFTDGGRLRRYEIKAMFTRTVELA